ncbi:hypothetical protein GLOIN_2v784473 [Rhizophagus irregularis DAOM 181602=DAOM 197198]|uniref:Uncharacterized protein n=1 Tax=Rhizophagus irregularis (strain DAOM 181602 / DAOM 197198 / MUCL 43194) TaxID=747089 RepID=A0A2P4QY38_RHIID|nr:hypothetical protein GLOIN_2v784473 [Rhizophagus irregularis DAOM 181602=DAOM 197198]POG82556.1 hypothetical protein GLOIN_2v784473 [Rhizophagus irregularis DAOM 181602=DAOM 197198]GET59190.1 hypothetical protein GLOIN_2v784473 [Rhizophagus irregularis DAOM 181602=DAOM 197198]|eukprot:XP_025189422.1 hypothetical protein GLOIN_2v784473 [Rhizophagus irregularis DAOM 181602=DAOM 197198]
MSLKLFIFFKNAVIGYVITLISHEFYLISHKFRTNINQNGFYYAYWRICSNNYLFRYVRYDVHMILKKVFQFNEIFIPAGINVISAELYIISISRD